MPLRLTKFEYDRLIAKRKSAATADFKSDKRVAYGRRWEELLAYQLDCHGYSGQYQTQFKFLEDRRFRFDFAFVPEKFAVEIDGQVHAIKARREGDVKRQQIAMMNGWEVLHVLPAQVKSGEALTLVTTILSERR